MKTIELIIDPQGEVRLETKGFAGESCREAAAFLRQSLGPVAQETRTTEFYSAQSGTTSPVTLHPPSP